MTDVAYRSLAGDHASVPRSSYLGQPETVARGLLGRLLVREEDDGAATVVRLVETEAYHQSDPASHSYRGETDANRVMFGAPGHLYVYFTYGMHHCMNVSCGPPGEGAAVLLRAAATVQGHDRIRGRRGDRHRDRDLLRGPGRLTEGLGVDREHNGVDVTDRASPLRVEDDGWRPDTGDVRAGPRTGVREAPDVAWRFWIHEVPEVSRYTRHPKA